MDRLNWTTDQLIDAFAEELKRKARSAERKYGFDDDWKKDNWSCQLRGAIRHHCDKGDPRDVALYAAFAWYHNWSLSASDQ